MWRPLFQSGLQLSGTSPIGQRIVLVVSTIRSSVGQRARVKVEPPVTLGQKSASPHSPHRGDRATQVRRPCKINRRLNAPCSRLGISRFSSNSTFTGSVLSLIHISEPT